MEHFFGVGREKTAIIPYGIDFSLFSPEPGPADSAIMERFGLRHKRFVIYPANTWYHKNHQGLIRVWKGLLSQLPGDIWLVLCGQIFDPLAAKSELGKYRIMHIGFVQQSELSALYRRSHAMVFPSFFEGFGAPPLEAMACGAVVISSRKASLAEVLPPAYPLHFDPENLEEMTVTILRGCIDEDTRNKAVITGNAFCRNFTWQETARKHIDFFDMLLNSTQGNET
jgi:glycosyltransferase involved in cell wall biosynthesis